MDDEAFIRDIAKIKQVGVHGLQSASFVLSTWDLGRHPGARVRTHLSSGSWSKWQMQSCHVNLHLTLLLHQVEMPLEVQFLLGELRLWPLVDPGWVTGTSSSTGTRKVPLWWHLAGMLVSAFGAAESCALGT